MGHRGRIGCCRSSSSSNCSKKGTIKSKNQLYTEEEEEMGYSDIQDSANNVPLTSLKVNNNKVSPTYLMVNDNKVSPTYIDYVV
jgi:hypothetical protein